MMNSLLLYFTHVLFRFLPETRLFAFKRHLLKFAGVKVGDDIRVCSSSTIMGSGELNIGSGTWIGHQVLICSSSHIAIGSSVDIAPKVYMGTGTHEIDMIGTSSAGVGVNQDIIIHDGVWIGASAVILPGVEVGKKAVIAAGSIVTNDVPSRTLVAGAPARVVKTYE